MDGRMDQTKGRLKQAAGDLTGNKSLKAEGKADEFRGNVKNKIEKSTDKLKSRYKPLVSIAFNDGRSITYKVFKP